MAVSSKAIADGVATAAAATALASIHRLEATLDVLRDRAARLQHTVESAREAGAEAAAQRRRAELELEQQRASAALAESRCRFLDMQVRRLTVHQQAAAQPGVTAAAAVAVEVGGSEHVFSDSESDNDDEDSDGSS